MKITRKPDWLRVSSIKNPNQDAVAGILKSLNLNTICREAICPNYNECFSRRVATFMILGTACTRNCRFCNVRHDTPQPVEADEPERIAQAVRALDMRYIVITSVTRDDLPDGGAEHFANTVRAIRKASPSTAIEVLVPDFQGSSAALKIVAESKPDVISHNMETVEELYPEVRAGAQYRRSLELLRSIKEIDPQIRSKSGIMLGLGETQKQVERLFDDLREVGCEFLTIGQYLAPSLQHLPVVEYIEPQRFEEYGKIARAKGFVFVASAPLVRSSYLAEEALGQGTIQK